MAQRGPAAVFLPDEEGVWRLAVEWTQDAWLRRPGPHDGRWRFVLVRDRGTGFVQLALATAADLLDTHPRGDVRAYDTFEQATAARAAFGRPPIAPEAW